MKIRIEAENIFIAILIFLSFYTYYKFPNKIGFVLFPIELIFVFFLFLLSGGKPYISGSVKVYLFFSFYRIIVGTLIEGSIKNSQSVVYRELGMLLFFLFAINADNYKRLLYIFRNVGVFLSLLGCVEFIVKDSFFIHLFTVETRIMTTYGIGTSLFRVRTIFGQPMPCATMELLFWVVILYFPYKKKWMNVIAKIAIVVCLIGTQTRSSWLIWGCITLIFYGKSIEKYITKETILDLFVVLLSAPLVVVIFRERIAGIYNLIVTRWKLVFDDNVSVSRYARVTEIVRALNIWDNSSLLNKLFGLGNGYLYSYLQNHPIRGYSDAVDIQYITTLVDSGLVGLFVLTLVLFAAIHELRYSNNIYTSCSCICILTILASGLFYDILGWIFITIPLCFFLSVQCISKYEYSMPENFLL